MKMNRTHSFEVRFSRRFEGLGIIFKIERPRNQIFDYWCIELRLPFFYACYGQAYPKTKK